MFMDPASFIDLGLRTFMRSPFLNLTGLALGEGECDFRLLERRDGVVVTLGPNTSFFDRPGRSVCRWPGTQTISRQSPHPVKRRSRIATEARAFMHILCGGGDVKFNRISTLADQRQILLTAGEGNVVEKIDLADLDRDGAPPLLLLQPSYLCSSYNVTVTSIPCDASVTSWARAPYVYKARPATKTFKPAILCITGRTMVWCERLQAGEGRDFALGNVIAATTNVTAKLRPTSQRHPGDASTSPDPQPSARDRTRKQKVIGPLLSFFETFKVFLDAIRAREGVLVCEMTNISDSPAYVFVQLNKSAFYGGSGLVGVVTRTIAYFLRLSHSSLGH